MKYLTGCAIIFEFKRWQDLEIFVESLYDAVVDCLKVVPILFLAYLLVSFLSHDHSHKFNKFLSKNKKTSVLYASFLGCVPQCGFSSVIADLYAEKHVSLGTLVAVFVATSDEAIPIMVSNTEQIVPMLLLIAVKIAFALFWGYLIDLSVGLFRKAKHKQITTLPAVEHQNEVYSHKNEDCHEHDEHHENNEHDESEHELHHHEEHHHSHAHECGHIHTDKCDKACGHEHGCCADNIFLDAFMHTFEIAIYIFIATFVINLIIGYCGTDALANVLTTNKYLQVLIASVIGLIPNCASSVLLVELFMYGTLSFPALVAGLSAGAGVGLFILWTKNRKHPLQNLGIMLLLYLVGVASGMFLTFFY